MDAALVVLGPLAWLDPTTKDIKLIGAVSWGYPSKFCFLESIFSFNDNLIHSLCFAWSVCGIDNSSGLDQTDHWRL